MKGTQTVVFTLSLIFTCIYIADLAPAKDEDSFNVNRGRILVEDEPKDEKDTVLKGDPEGRKMQPRILRLSPAGANLTNYSLQWIPLITVLTSPTVYYPPFG